MTGDHPLVLTRDEVRRIDAEAIATLGMPGIVLMEHAARGLCDVLQTRFASATKIIILCGPGNNGGDGFALARQLASHGLNPEIFLVAANKSLSQDAAWNCTTWQKTGGRVSNVNSDDELETLASRLTAQTSDSLIVDCLLGTGVRGAARPPYDRLIAAINNSQARVLSADLPSGFDCETGIVAGEVVQADVTVTFVGRKTGFDHPDAAAWTGDVEVAHIGLPQDWVREFVNRQRYYVMSAGDECK